MKRKPDSSLNVLMAGLTMMFLSLVLFVYMTYFDSDGPGRSVVGYTPLVLVAAVLFFYGAAFIIIAWKEKH